MKSILVTLLTLFLVNLSLGQSKHLFVDQFGYYKEGAKVAVITQPEIGFNATSAIYNPGNVVVKNADTDEIVFTGTLTAYKDLNIDSIYGDFGWWYDFTSFETAGSYYLYDEGNNLESDVFELSTNPYLEVLKVATKMFYYSRCGIAKETPYAASNWIDDISFNGYLQDTNARSVVDVLNPSLEKDLSGGWFDAGENYKSVTQSHTAVHNLCAAYEVSPELFGDDWNIPESGNGFPDLLDELKWELDWLLKMTNPDGSVHLKMGNQNYSENISTPPSLNNDYRFYGPTCSSASIVNASNFARASLIYKNIPGWESYALELEQNAISTFDHSLPFYQNGNYEIDCDDGSIVDGATDRDSLTQALNFLTAAVYLYELTGSSTYHNVILATYPTTEPYIYDYWSAYSMTMNDALLRYSSLPNANNVLGDEIKFSLINAIEGNYSNFYRNEDLGLYRSYMPIWSYHGGSNALKASYGSLNVLGINYNLGIGDELFEKADGMLHYFHGVNPMGLVYLSNMYDYGAEESVNEIYHFWFKNNSIYDNALTSERGPAPGFLVGGPNQYYSADSMAPPFNQPPAKSYRDFNDGWPSGGWAISQPAISYQSSYVRLLTEIVGAKGWQDETPSAIHDDSASAISISPNPATRIVTVESSEEISFLRIFSLEGKLLLDNYKFPIKSQIDIGGISNGVYVITAYDSDKGLIGTYKIVKK